MSNEPTLKDLLERDKDILEANKRKRQPFKVGPEIQMLSEFGLHYGWQAVRDVRDNKISLSMMTDMLNFARAAKAKERYDTLIDMYTANSAVQSKGGIKMLRDTLKGLKELWQQIK